MEKYLMVALGAALGGAIRYGVGTAVASRYSGPFPLGTFLINISGSFLIGLLMNAFASALSLHPNLRLFLVTGVLGGYTTFSAFEFEALAVLQGGFPWTSILYMTASVVLGLIAVWAGSALPFRN